MQFTEIPDELILKIFQYISVKDVTNCQLVNVRLNNLLNSSESLWRKFCFRDYAVSSNEIWCNYSAQAFYLKILHKFRHLFGWWKRLLDHYGGLVKIQIESDGIFSYNCLPPLDNAYKELVEKEEVILSSPPEKDQKYLHKFRFRRLFGLKDNGDGKIISVCYQSVNGQKNLIEHLSCPTESPEGHSCLESCFFKTKDGFKFVCHQKNLHDLDTHYWFEVDHGFRIPVVDEDEREKYEQFLRTNYHDLIPISVAHVDISPDLKKLLPKIGFYFGTYQVHGWEIIDVHFSDDGSFLEGHKITGDRNVPASKLSFRICFNKRLYLTQEDQNSMEELIMATARNESGNFEEIKSKENERQSFNIPADCYFSEGYSLPNNCISRFIAETQVAGDLFDDPKMTLAVFSMFDEESFGLLCMEFGIFLVFYRTENVTDTVAYGHF